VWWPSPARNAGILRSPEGGYAPSRAGCLDRVLICNPRRPDRPHITTRAGQTQDQAEDHRTDVSASTGLRGVRGVRSRARRRRRRPVPGRTGRVWRGFVPRGTSPCPRRGTARGRSPHWTAAGDESQYIAFPRGNSASRGDGVPCGGASCMSRSMSRWVISGASSASPAATTFTASTSRGGESILSRNPRRPRVAPRRHTRPRRR
jgi:hypothetical protein